MPPVLQPQLEGITLYYYMNYGVREYWIVDPRRKIVTVNYFEGNMFTVQY